MVAQTWTLVVVTCYWCLFLREDEPLFQAVRTGDINKVRRLVMHSGTKLMLPSKLGWLAIHQAAWYGQEMCLRVLLSGNTQTTQTDRHRHTPTHVRVCFLSSSAGDDQ